MDWKEILLMVIPAVLGIGFVWARITKVLSALKEIADVLLLIPKILEDKKVTTEEKTELIVQLREAIAAVKAIVTK